MGEEAQKPPEEKKPEEEKKVEEAAKPEEKKAEEAKDAPPPPPPPPQEIVLRVFMHCEGCARKVRKCLKGFDGVEDVQTDCKTHKVVVKGEKADPLKVYDRVQKKSHRQVELLSPIPPKPPAEEPKVEEKEAPKPEEKKEEPPQVINVVLKVNMHCEACAQEIRKRILRMKGVESAEPDLKASEVSVKGTFTAAALVDYIHKRTGKQALIVKQDPEPKKEEEKPKEEKKDDGGEKKEEKKDAPAGGAEEKDKDKDKDKDKGKEEKKDGGGEEAAKPEGGPPANVDELNVVELRKNEFYYYHPQNYQVWFSGKTARCPSRASPQATRVRILPTGVPLPKLNRDGIFFVVPQGSNPGLPRDGNPEGKNPPHLHPAALSNHACYQTVNLMFMDNNFEIRYIRQDTLQNRHTGTHQHRKCSVTRTPMHAQRCKNERV